MYTTEKSANWKKRNVCAETNIQHVWSTIRSKILNSSCFLSCSKRFPCKSFSVYIVYAGRRGKVQSYEIYRKSLQTTCQNDKWWMSSEVLYRVALVRPDISENISPSFVTVTAMKTSQKTVFFCNTQYPSIGRLINKDSMVTTVESYHPEDGGTYVLQMLGLTTATWCNIPQDIHHCYHH
jgi:hypothetical protein